MSEVELNTQTEKKKLKKKKMGRELVLVKAKAKFIHVFLKLYAVLVKRLLSEIQQEISYQFPSLLLCMHVCFDINRCFLFLSSFFVVILHYGCPCTVWRMQLLVSGAVF